VVSRRTPEDMSRGGAVGAVGAGERAERPARPPPPRAVWMMIPAGEPVARTIELLLPHLDPDDVLIDGGNSNYRDSMARAEALKERGISFLDVGTSGGVWGLEQGYCLMVGGEEGAFRRLEPIFASLAPEGGYARVGPSGAGHFVKMIHNGIEYGLLEAYGEGFEMLHASPFGLDLHQIAALWGHGSVIRSWLLELLEGALKEDPSLAAVGGYVEDSGEGRWAVKEAVDGAVPIPIIALSLFARFRSRQGESFSAKVIAALRHRFGGHATR